MKKRHKIVMLQSEKASKFYKCIKRTGDYHFNTKENTLHLDFKSEPSKEYFEPQHLYILSDEEIKEGDWYISPKFHNSIHQWSKDNISTDKQRKKIIATTNPDLWGKNFTERDKEIWYDGIPKISLDFVERYAKEYNKGNIIKEVMLEYECSQGFSSCDKIGCKVLKLRSNGLVIISSVEERKYTFEEMVKSYRLGFNNGCDKLHKGAEEQIRQNFP